MSKKWLACFCKQLKYDNRNGILHKWKTTIPIVIFACFACGKFLSVYSYQLREMPVLQEPSTADFIVDMFKGMEKYEPHIRTKPFEIPAFYMLFNIYISYVVAKYPFDDLRGIGKQILVKSKKRMSWLMSKFIWCAEIIVIFYMVTYMVAGIFSVCMGNLGFCLSEDVNRAVSNLQLPQAEFWVNAVVLPIIVSIGISYVQLLVSFRWNRLAGNITTIILVCLSAYYDNTFLLGNYLMLLRNSVIVGKEGVNAKHGVIICGLLIVVCFVLARRELEQKDIF